MGRESQGHGRLWRRGIQGEHTAQTNERYKLLTLWSNIVLMHTSHGVLLLTKASIGSIGAINVICRGPQKTFSTLAEKSRAGKRPVHVLWPHENFY